MDLSRKNKILITAQLLMPPTSFAKFRDHFDGEYNELCKDVFEYTIRGMGDHAPIVHALNQVTGTFNCKCSCGKIEFRNVTLRSLWTEWSKHVQLEQLEEFKRRAATPGAA